MFAPDGEKSVFLMKAASLESAQVSCPTDVKPSSGQPLGSLYERVRSQLDVLASRFGLLTQRHQIACAFETICKESLAIPLGRQAPVFSRINEDGTPFQYALTLSRDVPAPLQFLGEVGSPGFSMARRIAMSHDRIRTLCSLLGKEAIGERVCTMIDRFAAPRGFQLHANHDGVFWLAVGFFPRAEPRLTVYINGKLATGGDARQRAAEFSSCFGAGDAWNEIAAALVERMEPLGFAVTVSEQTQLSGRIYIASRGNPLSSYGQIVEMLGPPGALDELRGFAENILGCESRYPIPSAVCSVGLSPHFQPDLKLEVCGHCVFPNNVEAVARCMRWLSAARTNADRYQDVIQVISQGSFEARQTQLHPYVGLGWKSGRPYTSIYLNPGMISASAESE